METDRIQNQEGKINHKKELGKPSWSHKQKYQDQRIWIRIIGTNRAYECSHIYPESGQNGHKERDYYS